MSLEEPSVIADDASLTWKELLPSTESGPEEALIRSHLVDTILAAIDELPERQRQVFVAHEIDGLSFSEIADRTGERVNTLISRKHQAVVRLRRRLRKTYDELKQSNRKPM